jgi:lysophospholipase L1-like esterase
VLICVAFGDSTTAPRIVDGEPLEVYTSILEKRLAGEGVIPRMVNRGVQGNTTADARRRIAGDVLSLQTDIVILQFGIDDAGIDVPKELPAGSSWVAVADYENNLGAMIGQLKAVETEIVLMTPNPVRSASALRNRYVSNLHHPDDPDGMSTRLKGYAEAVRRIAASEKLPLVDVYSAFQDYPKTHGKPVDELLLDGIHPNSKGHELIADLIMERLNAGPR